MLPYSEACERNKDPILEVLRSAFATRRQVLEIGSGTGQHAVYFAARLPHLTWQPTDQALYLHDLAERVRLEGPDNLKAPVLLDVGQPSWPMASVDAVFTANTLHIMSWPQAIQLIHGVGAALQAGGTLCVYGPFRYDGRYTSPSNQNFDQMLQARDPQSGLREFAQVVAECRESGLMLSADHDLPANNRLLVFERVAAERVSSVNSEGSSTLPS